MTTTSYTPDELSVVLTVSGARADVLAWRHIMRQTGKQCTVQRWRDAHGGAWVLERIQLKDDHLAWLWPVWGEAAERVEAMLVSEQRDPLAPNALWTSAGEYCKLASALNVAVEERAPAPLLRRCARQTTPAQDQTPETTRNVPLESLTEADWCVLLHAAHLAPDDTLRAAIQRSSWASLDEREVTRSAARLARAGLLDDERLSEQGSRRLTSSPYAWYADLLRST